MTLALYVNTSHHRSKIIRIISSSCLPIRSGVREQRVLPEKSSGSSSTKGRESWHHIPRSQVNKGTCQHVGPGFLMRSNGFQSAAVLISSTMGTTNLIVRTIQDLNRLYIPLCRKNFASNNIECTSRFHLLFTPPKPYIVPLCPYFGASARLHVTFMLLLTLFEANISVGISGL